MLETFFNMDPWTFVAFGGACILLFLTPGADMMFTIASGLAGGPRAGLAAAAGIICGMVAHVVLAAAGLAVIVATSPIALDVIRWVGALYLGWLAYKSWTSKGEPDQAQGRADLVRAFRRGLITNILNPKVGLFVLAFLPQFADPAIGPIWHQILILGVFLAVGGLITDGAVGVFAGVASVRIKKSTRLMRKISAIVFGGLAARLAFN